MPAWGQAATCGHVRVGAQNGVIFTQDTGLWHHAGYVVTRVEINALSLSSFPLK